MKGILILLLLYGCGWGAAAQGKYDANWCFATNAGINFSDTSQPTFFNTIAGFSEETASISDSLGHLLFYISNYSNIGVFYIRDASNDIIRNGDSIGLIGTYTNGAMIIPGPINSKKWYLFHLLKRGFNPSFGYSTIEQDSIGLKVSAKNIQLLSDSVEEKVTAIKHSNGRDWWVLVHQQYSNRFYKFLIEKDTIKGPFIQDIGSIRPNLGMFNYSYIGEIAFSRNGKYLACAIGDQNEIELFNFNRCSGELFNYISIANIGAGKSYGCEFSPDESKLYLTQFQPSWIYEFDLNAHDISASKITVWPDTINLSNQGAFSELQLAPDNKIYMVSPFNSSLGVINSPDSMGYASNFRQLSLFFGVGGARGDYGLPNMPNYNLGPISIYAAHAGKDTTICNTNNTGVTLGTAAVAGVVYSWQPGSGLSDSTLAQPTAQPDSTTQYILTVTDTTQTANSCTTRTDTVLITVQTCDTTGINELALLRISIYPNPATNRITVQVPGTTNPLFYLYDYTGQTVLQQALQSGTNTLDITHLSQGLYLYRCGRVGGKMQVVR